MMPHRVIPALKRPLMSLIFASALALPTLALPTLAQDSRQSTAFDVASDRLEQLMKSGATEAEIYRHLSASIRTARTLGGQDPDFAIFYAMLTDHVRNVELNPLYALKLAEEGLALVTGRPNHLDFATVLQVSRSYALADLGRLEEAATQAFLILPTYETVIGSELAGDYRLDAEKWAAGLLSPLNTAATELARKTLDQVQERLEAESYAQALTLAGTALLPMNSGLPESDLRGLNAEAEFLTARALEALGRYDDAANAYLRALGYMTATSWDFQSPLEWAQGAAPADPNLRAVTFDVLMGIATAAGRLRRFDLEFAAVEQAIPFADNPFDRFTATLRQARIASLSDRKDEVLPLLTKARDIALADNDAPSAHLAQFYLAQVEMQFADPQTRAALAPNLIAATEAAERAFRAAHHTDLGFLYQAATDTLIGTDGQSGAAVTYARRAMQSKQAELARRSDSGFGQTAARQATRGDVDRFLDAAYFAGAEGLDPDLTAPECEDPRDYNGCTIRLRP